MTNEEIARAFDQLALLLDMKGESPFKVRAYQRAARTIAEYPVDFQALVREGRPIQGIPGIGEAISEKIVQLVTTGRMKALDEAQRDVPEGVLSLLDVPGVGPKTAMRLARDLGVRSPEDLEKAIVEGRVATLPRMSEKGAQKILEGLQTLKTKDRRMPLGRALPLSERLVAQMRARYDGIVRIEAAGSIRRWQETIGDVDFVAVARDRMALADAFTTMPDVAEVLAKGDNKCSVLLRGGVRSDILIVDDAEWGSALHHFTGSKQHNIQLREYARERGLSISEYGIQDITMGAVERFPTEEALFRRLGLQHIPPELRLGGDEIERAALSEIPRIVTLEDVRGDMHVHSTWSDGRDSLEAMLRAARGRGLSYVAMTEHSVGRAVARGLSAERVREYASALAAAAQAEGIQVLHGTEMDIRADGSMDYSDGVMESLEWVVASVHSAMDQPREKMTERVLRAVRHPLVDCVGHLTARLIGERPPTQVDVEAVLRAAAENGTALEINGSWPRLDLKDVHARRARELGVPLVLTTDAHATDDLGWMRYGVAVARRAGCEARHILNTRPLAEVRRFLDAPKGPTRRDVWRRMVEGG